MKETEKLKQQWLDAMKYVNKVGAPQHHYRDGSAGKIIHMLKENKLEG